MLTAEEKADSKGEVSEYHPRMFNASRGLHAMFMLLTSTPARDNPRDWFTMFYPVHTLLQEEMDLF